jgi:hypothetical protein
VRLFSKFFLPTCWWYVQPHLELAPTHTSSAILT